MINSTIRIEYALIVAPCALLFRTPLKGLAQPLRLIEWRERLVLRSNRRPAEEREKKRRTGQTQKRRASSGAVGKGHKQIQRQHTPELF